MKRLRAGAYSEGNYLIRYLGWLPDWDGDRENYRPWHVYRRASRIDSSTLLECFRTLDEAKMFVAERLRARSREGGIAGP